MCGFTFLIQCSNMEIVWCSGQFFRLDKFSRATKMRSEMTLSVSLKRISFSNVVHCQYKVCGLVPVLTLALTNDLICLFNSKSPNDRDFFWFGHFYFIRDLDWQWRQGNESSTAALLHSKCSWYFNKSSPAENTPTTIEQV